MMQSRVFRVVLIVYIALAGIYTSTTPIFEKPDENWHFAVSMHILETGQLPQNTPHALPHYSRQQANQPPLYYLSLTPILHVLGFQNLRPGFLYLSKPNEHFLPETPRHQQDNQRLFIQGRCDDNCIRTRNAVYVGRFLSATYVGLSLIFIALSMDVIFPREKTFALISIALIAFNPQVLYIGTSVSNDGLSMCLMSIGFYLVALWLKGKRGYPMVIVMALVAGAAILSKLSAATLGLLLGVLLLWTSQKRIRDIAIFGFSSLAISAWWFIHNIRLYGNPTALDLHISLAPQQVAPETWQALIAQLPEVGRSFWAEFGWGQIQLPASTYNLMFIVAGILSLISLINILYRWRKLNRQQKHFLLFSAATFAIVFLLMLRWMSMTHAPHGRLLFPSVFPISLFLAYGITCLLKQKWEAYAVYGLILGLIFIAIMLPIRYILPAYQALEPLTEPVLQAELISFSDSDGAHILVRDIALIEDNDVMYIQVTWEIVQAMQDDYLVFIHILDEDAHIISQRDTYPGLSNMPFSRMQVGQVFHDVYPLVNPGSPILTVRIGLYKFGDLPNTWIRLDAESEAFDVQDNAVIIPRASIRYESAH